MDGTLERGITFEDESEVCVTDIIRLPDNEGNQRPVMARAYALRDSNDDLVAIEKFTIRYNRVPDEVWVWRGMMYIPTVEGEK